MSSRDSSGPRASRAQGETRPAGWQRQPGDVRLEPGLHIVSTPIGNLRDITLRALDTLAAADEILAEDTRTARKLLDAYSIRGKLTPYHDHNGAQRRPEILSSLETGAAIALISDAGTPLVSDPGFKLAREAALAGHRIIPVPGASAALAGLVMAGLPSDRFLFAGFLPPKSGARCKALKGLAAAEATLIFYESGPRLAASLADMAATLGAAREACVAREITKLFEEARRGDLAGLAAHYAEAGPPRGEIVVLVGPPLEDGPQAEEIDAALLAALAELPTKQAANAVADRFAIPRRDAYQRALELKDAEG